jgi:hypothetical protein
MEQVTLGYSRPTHTHIPATQLGYRLHRLTFHRCDKPPKLKKLNKLNWKEKVILMVTVAAPFSSI